MKHTAIETQVEEVAVQARGMLRSRYGLWVLAGISFLESALPIPLITDPFLIAYVLANKQSVYKGVVITTVSSVIGGLFAYALAFSFYEVIVEQYLTGVVEGQFADIIEHFKQGVFIVTLAGAVTPVPYTLVALGAGFLKASVFLFLAASIVGRGARYALVGYVTYRFGDRALGIMRRNVILITLVFVLGTLAYFLVK